MSTGTGSDGGKAKNAPAGSGATPIPGGTVRGLDTDLANAVGPAFVIDCTRARIIGGNQSGLTLWGIDGKTMQVALSLDRSMPALNRLASLLSELRPGAVEFERLAFWFPAGIRSVPCRLTRPAPADLEGISPTAIMVELLDGAETASPDTVTEDNDGAGNVGKVAPAAEPPRPRHDRETLEEIARRIRAGRNGAAPLPREGAPPPIVAVAPILPPKARPVSAALPSIEAAPAPMMPGQPATVAVAPDPTPTRAADGGISQLKAIARLAGELAGETVVLPGRTDLRILGTEIRRLAERGLASFERPAPPMTFTEVDLNRIVEETLSAFAPKLAEARITVGRSLAPRLPRVVADARALRHILSALIANVIRHAGPAATLEVATGYQTAGPVTLLVSDDGPGMTQDAIGTALAPRPLGGGGPEGRGLSIAARLAAGNGARLEIEPTGRAGLVARLVIPKDRVIPV